MTLTLAEGAQMTSSADIISGRCAVWALPHTAACAAAARTKLREVLQVLLRPSQLDDCVTMVSELATNAFLYGLAGRKLDSRHAPDAGRSELAVYRRGHESNAELVVTVYDPRPDLDSVAEQTKNPLAELPDKSLDERLPAHIIDHLLSQLPDEPLPESPEVAQHLHPKLWSGRRGLDTVRELSKNNCGFYRTRSRLGARPVSGKVAWFAVELCLDSLAARPPQAIYSPAEATQALCSQLQARGMTHLIQNDLHDRSVLSLRHSTVWIDTTGYTWRTGAEGVRHPHADLVEVVEQLVRINEDREYSPLQISL
jgi:anti-sigma regulatory factor (Ser/Thr protein kinase)